MTKRYGRNVLANNVRCARIVQNLTQEALADLSGIHRSYVSDLERSKRNIGIDCLMRLASALGVPAADLLTEHAFPPRHPLTDHPFENPIELHKPPRLAHTQENDPQNN